MNRDMVGYGQIPPNTTWPNGARLALNFVINYEEGAELTPLNHDKLAESYGAEFLSSLKPEGVRNLGVESLYEYGSRVGIWRLQRLFDESEIPLTFFVTGMALTLNKAFCVYLKTTEHEVAGHGWRWIDYSSISAKKEKEHIRACKNAIQELTHKTPLGWYTGRRSENTRRLLLEEGGFLYDSDSYADELPYFLDDHLIIPYTLDCNDFRFTTNPGFGTAQDFYSYLKAHFDYTYHEGRMNLMTIGLHPRISGRPARTEALRQFLDYIMSYDDIWIAKREDIARFWMNMKEI